MVTRAGKAALEPTSGGKSGELCAHGTICTQVKWIAGSKERGRHVIGAHVRMVTFLREDSGYPGEKVHRRESGSMISHPEGLRLIRQPQLCLTVSSSTMCCRVP
jgi:hypothetical protein